MTYKYVKKSDFWTVVDGICRLLSSGVHAKARVAYILRPSDNPQISA